MVFWDTSALVKAYSGEVGSPTVQAAFVALPPHQTLLSPYVALETLTVLTKRLRQGTFTKSQYQKARTEFFRDYPRGFVRIPVKRHIRRNALVLAETHRGAGIGALDILHLACALDVKATAHPQPVVLAVVDGPLRRVARQEGLRTFDPETQTVSDLLAAMR